MKSIIFAGMICCLIAAVDAPCLITDPPKLAKGHKQVNTSSQSMMQDLDAAFWAAE
jgi:hypothetical protein